MKTPGKTLAKRALAFLAGAVAAAAALVAAQHVPAQQQQEPEPATTATVTSSQPPEEKAPPAIREETRTRAALMDETASLLKKSGFTSAKFKKYSGNSAVTMIDYAAMKDGRERLVYVSCYPGTPCVLPHHWR